MCCAIQVTFLCDIDGWYIDNIWMIIDSIFECTFVIDDRFIIVNINKMVFVLRILKILIITRYNISNDKEQYQLWITSRYELNNQLPTPPCPLSHDSQSYQAPLSHPFPTPQQGINTRQQ